MLHHLKAQLYTWYLRYHFFTKVSCYQLVVDISQTLSLRASLQDYQHARRSALRLLQLSPDAPLISSLIEAITQEITAFPRHAAEIIFDAYYQANLPSMLEHEGNLHQLEQALFSTPMTDDVLLNLHKDLLLLYSAHPQPILDNLIAWVYQNMSEAALYQVWEAITRPAFQLDRAYTQLYPFHRTLVQVFLEKGYIHKEKLQSLYTYLQHVPKYCSERDNYVQLCGWLMAVGVMPDSGTKLETSSLEIMHQIARHQANFSQLERVTDSGKKLTPMQMM